MASKAPTSTNNSDGATVWFVLSSVGNKFDNLVDNDIIWSLAKTNNKTLAVVCITRADSIEDNVPHNNPTNNNI